MHGSGPDNTGDPECQGHSREVSSDDEFLTRLNNGRHAVPKTEHGQYVHAQASLAENSATMCYATVPTSPTAFVAASILSDPASPHRGFVTLQNRFCALREEADIPAAKTQRHPEAVLFDLSGTEPEKGCPPCTSGVCSIGTL